MARVNKTKYAILGLLHYGPMSGYDLKKITDVSIAHFWHENFGHIYPVLGSMERDGLLVKETIREAGRPAKNVYSITGKGREEFNAWLTEPVDPLKLRVELLLKVFFGSRLSTENLIGKLVAEKEYHLDKLRQYGDTARHLESEDKEDAPFWSMTLRYGVLYSKSMVQWCEECKELLEKRMDREGAQE